MMKKIYKKYPNQKTHLGMWINTVRQKSNIELYNFMPNYVKNDIIHKNMYKI